MELLKEYGGSIPSHPAFSPPRAAQERDLEELVERDMVAFKSVYAEQGLSEDEQRADLTRRYISRLEMLGDWMQVLEYDGKICGSITCCPTNRTPEEFTSWESMTDNGTLRSTYDPDGRNLYVASIFTTPEVAGTDAQYMLMFSQLGKMMTEQIDSAFFESRLPGLRTWVRSQCREQQRDFSSLGKQEIQEFAESYFKLTKNVDGKEVPYDPLIRMYAGFRAQFLKLIPDAYQDGPSMNFGVVCVVNNPLPPWLRKKETVSRFCGNAVRRISKSYKLSRKAKNIC